MIQVKLTTQSTVKEEQKYNGILGTAGQIMKEDGPFGFYRGFVIAWQRAAPLIVIQMMCYEQIKRLVFA